jgi:hypothetical protein
LIRGASLRPAKYFALRIVYRYPGYYGLQGRAGRGN